LIRIVKRRLWRRLLAPPQGPANVSYFDFRLGTGQAEDGQITIRFRYRQLSRQSKLLRRQI
jgi:hypothetical protein